MTDFQSQKTGGLNMSEEEKRELEEEIKYLRKRNVFDFVFIGIVIALNVVNIALKIIWGK